MKHPYKAKNIADKLLEDWDDVCKGLSIPHFVICGTCLGFYRDKGYIEGDSDLDVGVLCTPQKLEELLKALTQKGVRRGAHLTSNINTFRKNILLDIWFEFGPLHQVYFKKLDAVTYKGRNYNTPHPIEGYLEFVYGDWRKPVKGGKALKRACTYTKHGPTFK